MLSKEYQADLILEVVERIVTATNKDEDYRMRMVFVSLTNGASTRGPSWLEKNVLSQSGVGQLTIQTMVPVRKA